MWAKLTDDHPGDPKILAVGLDGKALYVDGLCYCGRYLTDGFIPKAALPGLSPLVPDPAAAAAKLLKVGLWIEREDGYEVANFLKHNNSKEEYEARREGDRKRLQDWRNARRNADGNGVSPPTMKRRTSVRPEPEPEPEPDPVPDQTRSHEKDRGSAEGAAPPRPPSKPKYELTEEQEAIRDLIEQLAGIRYPPMAFKPLRARLDAGDTTPEQAEVILRAAAQDRFWGSEVKLNPGVLFNTKNFPAMLALAAKTPLSRPEPPPRRYTQEQIDEWTSLSPEEKRRRLAAAAGGAP